MVKNLKLYYLDLLRAGITLFFDKSISADEFSLNKGFDYCIMQNKKIYDSVELPKATIYRKAQKGFQQYLKEITKEFSSPQIERYFSYAQAKSHIYISQNLNLIASISVNKNDQEVDTTIQINAFDGTNKTYIELIHELSHFYQFYLSRKRNIVEPIHLLEVIPIYFEYLMYVKTSNEPFSDFVNNRLSMTFGVQDNNIYNERLIALLSQKNNDPKIAKCLEQNQRYFYGFLLALSLIERRKNYKVAVEEEIRRVLVGEHSSYKMIRNLDINPYDLKPIEKVLRKTNKKVK